MLASGAEVQRFSHSALVHLSDNLSAMALCKPSVARKFFERFPFICQLLRQFPVGCFCAPFEPPNLSIIPNAIVTGDPERGLFRLVRVLSD